MRARGLKELGLIKVGLDEDSCRYVLKRRQQLLQESKEGARVEVAAQLNGLAADLERNFCASFL